MSEAPPIRLILDTNVWLDWLLFRDPSTAPIQSAIAGNRAEVFIDADCEAELGRALAYPFGKWTLDVSAQAVCLAECRRVARRIDAGISQAQRAELPLCRDPDDQKFLEAALAAGAAYLLTKDRALLDLERRLTRLAPFRILTPAAFAEVF